MAKPPNLIVTRNNFLRLNKEQNLNMAPHQPRVMDHWRCEASNNLACHILSLSERAGMPQLQRGSAGCSGPNPPLNGGEWNPTGRVRWPVSHSRAAPAGPVRDTYDWPPQPPPDYNTAPLAFNSCRAAVTLERGRKIKASRRSANRLQARWQMFVWNHFCTWSAEYK